jgi:hypothetical protein
MNNSTNSDNKRQRPKGFGKSTPKQSKASKRRLTGAELAALDRLGNGSATAEDFTEFANLVAALGIGPKLSPERLDYFVRQSQATQRGINEGLIELNFDTNNFGG